MLELWEYVGKTVKLKHISGKKITGKVIDWTDGYTSVSGEEEISIGSAIYAESDLKSIKLIEDK